MLGYRSSDAVITICQNNKAKSIEIREINKVAQEMLGYGAKELADKPLVDILPPRIGQMLVEYVEFEEGSNDVGEVLTKVQSFSAVNKQGKESGYRLKIVRDASTADTITFKLVLQDKLGLRRNEALRDMIQQNFKGHESLDPDLSLPDRKSLGKDIELLGHYNSKNTVRSCCGVMQVDHYDELFSQYGRKASQDMLRHIATVCRQSLRPDDVVGYLSPKRLGVLLLDTTPDSGRVVFNRLRWQIAANPFMLPDKTSMGISVSIAFSRIGGLIADRNLLDECETTIANMGEGAVNLLIEVEEAQKRQSQANP